MQKNTHFEHKARKRFGQNFLINESIIRQIIRSISPNEKDNLIEIGPGKGALTHHLLDACPRLNVIELDRDLIPILLAQFVKFPDFKIHQSDALKFDFSSLFNEQPMRIIGNLPYNISTPLIFHLLSFRHEIRDMHFMLQKEVVARLTATPGDKLYGRLSVMTQYFCDAFDLFDVPPTSFSPAPKVNSAIVRLVPLKAPTVTANNLEVFEAVVKAAFQQRRKTLRNALKLLLGETIDPASLPIDLSQRAEKLSVVDFVNLSNAIDAHA